MADGNAAPTTATQAPTNPEAATKRPLSLLAAEAFGDDFHGEVPDEAPAAAETTPADSEPVTEQPEAESAEQPEQAEPDVSELIRQHFEQDGDLLKKVKLGVKIDGQHGEATLDDLVRSYQIQTAAEKRLEEAKSKSAEVLAEATAKATKINERFAEAAGLIESLEADLADDIKAADMDKLRREDPAEWAARNAEFDKRRQKIQQRKQSAVEKYHKANHQAQEEAKTAFEKYLASEQSALMEKRPEWRDAEKFKAESKKLKEFLAGVNTNTAQQVSHNHELLLLAHEAMLYRELRANTNAAAKKLEKVPKVLKPGTPTPPEVSNKARLEKLRSTARKTGSLDDAFALLKAQRG
jgi:hypothetical protein